MSNHKKQSAPKSTKRQAHRSSAVDKLSTPLPVRWTPLWVAFAANLLLFALTYLLFSPQFNTRDDTGMMFLAAGKVIALEPTEYLIFTNIIIGHILKALYLVAPSMAWYAWYLVATLFAAHVALLYVMLSRKRTIVVLALYTAYFFVSGAYMLLSLQFTMTSSIAALGSMALLFFLPYPERDDESSWVQNLTTLQGLSLPVLFGVLLLVWSFMIRMEACLMVLACIMPLLGVRMVFADSRGWLLRQLPALAIGIILCMGAYSYNSYRYNSWGTFNYIEFNKLCSEFLDVNIVRRTVLSPQTAATVLKAGGNWSMDDLEMLQNWFFMDEKLYTTESLTRVRDELVRLTTTTRSNAQEQSDNEAHQTSLRQKLYQRQIATFTSDRALYSFAVAMVAACLMLPFNRKAALYTAGFLVTLFAVALYINEKTLLRDTLERVTHPLFACVCLLPMLLTEKRSSQAIHQRTTLRLVGSALALTVVFIAVFNTCVGYAATSRQIKSDSKELESIIQTLYPHADQLFVVWADGFPFQYVAPFSSLDAFASFHALWLSWSERTPTSKAVLERFGVQNIYWDLATKPNVVFLLSLNQNMRPELRYPTRYGKYMVEHYGRVVNDKGGSRFLTNYPETDPSFAYRTYMVGKMELDSAPTTPRTPQP